MYMGLSELLSQLDRIILDVCIEYMAADCDLSSVQILGVMP